MGVGGLGGCHNFFIACLGAAVGDVFPNGARPQPRVLEHHAVISPQGRAGHGANVVPRHRNAAAVHVVKPHEQVDEGGLAAAGGADDGDALSRPDVQAEVLEQGTVGGVGEGHVPDGHLAVAHKLDGVGSVGNLIGLVQQVEDPLNAGHGVLKLRDHAGDLVEGLGILVGIAQKDAQLSHTDAAAHGEEGAGETHGGVDHAVDKPGHGVGEAGEEHGLDGGGFEPLVHLVKGFLALFLVAEGLHHPLPLDHLLHQGGLFAADGGLGLEIAVGAAGDKPGGEEAQGREHHHHGGDAQVDHGHEDQRTGDGEDAGEELGEAHEQAVGEGVHIGDDAADQVTGGVAVQVGERQALKLLHGCGAQILGDAEGNAVVAGRQHPLRHGGDGRGDGDGETRLGHQGEVHPPHADHGVDGVAAEDGHQQLRRHADGRAQKAGSDKEAVRTHQTQHPAKKGAIGLAHPAAPPFSNWLSKISR